MIRFILFSVFVLIGYVSTAQQTHTITVKVTNASSDDGQLVIGLYDDEDKFLKNSYMGQMSPINKGSAMITFNNVPSGTYAVSLFHDENKNDKLDSNFMGIPKEDYACSNDAKGFMGPPSWSDAKFEVNENLTIEVKL